MKYELNLILSPKLSDDEAKEEVKKVEKIFADFKAVVLESIFLGKKNLAYEIGDFNQGYYSIIKIDTEPGLIDKIRQKIKDYNSVIRLLVMKPEKEIKIKIKKTKEKTDRTILKNNKDFLDEKKIVKKSEPQRKEDLDVKINKILEGDIVD